jgi:hypothetical protein
MSRTKQLLSLPIESLLHRSHSYRHLTMPNQPANRSIRRRPISREERGTTRLILADPIQIRRSGVGLAEVATMFLQTQMNDKPLAMAIMDLYVMPYLHLGDKRRETICRKPTCW